MGGGFTAAALLICFSVVVDEDVEGGEAETLLTTEETTERSTGVCISMVLQRSWDWTHSSQTSRLGLGQYLSWCRNRRSAGIVCCVTTVQNASLRVSCDLLSA